MSLVSQTPASVSLDPPSYDTPESSATSDIEVKKPPVKKQKTTSSQSKEKKREKDTTKDKETEGEDSQKKVFIKKSIKTWANVNENPNDNIRLQDTVYMELENFVKNTLNSSYLNILKSHKLHSKDTSGKDIVFNESWFKSTLSGCNSEQIKRIEENMNQLVKSVLHSAKLSCKRFKRKTILLQDVENAITALQSISFGE